MSKPIMICVCIVQLDLVFARPMRVFVTYSPTALVSIRIMLSKIFLDVSGLFH